MPLLQILETQDFEEIPAKPSDSLRSVSEEQPMASFLLAPTDMGPLGPVGPEPHRRPGRGPGVAPLDPEAQRRLSLQESHTALDSRTPQRHSSDPGS